MVFLGAPKFWRESDKIRSLYCWFNGVGVVYTIGSSGAGREWRSVVCLCMHTSTSLLCAREVNVHICWITLWRIQCVLVL
jgi:hypothetical protein